MALRLLVPLLAVVAACALPTTTQARTVYRCVRDGTVSLATAPEPGSRCVAHQLDDNSPILPNLWGTLGLVHGTLYRREQDGQTVYGTRNLPGSTPLFAFAVRTPDASPAHVGLGRIGRPRLDEFPRQFRNAAKATGVDEAWLRAIAHAESAYDAGAVSPKGAQGVMQLMPQVSDEYGVKDPFSARESILAGARHLKALQVFYAGDLTLVAAAYNAGVGAVAQYGGVPPYAETQTYVAKVQALYARYRAAMRLPPRPARLQAAQ